MQHNLCASAVSLVHDKDDKNRIQPIGLPLTHPIRDIALLAPEQKFEDLAEWKNLPMSRPWKI
ncbi:MAG: hypothetical protein N0C81_09320 [Candidatus Thiodiazotropha lotti]|uniref:Uncharacterized protein n=1 Tax=Candidatus Thiodiazotropha lotti TaxID=2792787 RepID=A0A9E4K7H9_9GAMM|nr:hypothetical protein [Candidatus Thiodiazotropha lotti]ODC01381.1 hypothetical protein A3197_02565 [Candidatus Thiodiazotropha endoloripes]MCG7920508.1 hypothetical protein [Candidatus Thiodiazotropha lotti]MCG7930552.1 hypothetical protein [Candidatus Thiodiazotropha lotti]MCG7940170.1 hypothetical protein [Candidatus Thiodiazotropha lotti]